MDFWDLHGIWFVIFLAIFPRLTLLFSSVISGGWLWWLGWVFTPRLLVAILSLPFWETNSLLVIFTWFWALGGEYEEKKSDSRDSNPSIISSLFSITTAVPKVVIGFCRVKLYNLSKRFTNISHSLTTDLRDARKQEIASQIRGTKKEVEKTGKQITIIQGRCPYCHTGILSSDNKHGCEKCTAWHHLECWKGHGGCSACGYKPFRLG